MLSVYYLVMGHFISVVCLFFYTVITINEVYDIKLSLIILCHLVEMY